MSEAPTAFMLSMYVLAQDSMQRSSRELRESLGLDTHRLKHLLLAACAAVSAQAPVHGGAHAQRWVESAATQNVR